MKVLQERRSAAFAALMDPGIEDIADIRTAVSEAVTNCIVHAYRDTEGIIEITGKILSDNELYIRIKDKGCGIPDIKKGYGTSLHNRSV